MSGDVYSDSVTYRARFSAITDKDIKAAFNNLGKVKYAEHIFKLGRSFGIMLEDFLMFLSIFSNT